MKCMFLDESGDQGFNFDKGSTRFFVITLLVCGVKEQLPLQRIIKKKVRERTLKKKLRESSEIKWSNSNEQIKEKVFKGIKNIDFEVFAIILNKPRVYGYLRDEKHKLYNYLSKLIIAECSVNGSVELVVDRSKNKRSLRDDFDNHIKNNFGRESTNFKIKHEDSKSNGVLQILDFISGAIFHKYESDNLEYYNKIKDKITTEKRFL